MIVMIYKNYKFRIYPNQEQQILIGKTIGCSRFVFNRFLSEWNKTYEETGAGLNYSACSAKLTVLKKESETLWLQEVDSIALQSALRNLSDSFNRFFKKQNKAPRFKSKRNPIQSYTTKQTNGNIAVVGNKLKLPKLGLVKFAKSKEVDGRIMSATIRRNPSGNYYISILVETDSELLPKTGSACGVDVGLKDFAVVSDESVYENPRFFQKLERKLAKGIAPGGRVRLELRRPWRDGTRALLFDPLDFLGRLAALTPKPRVNLLLYHGVFAPHAARRRAAVARAREDAGGTAEARAVSDPSAGRSSPPAAGGSPPAGEVAARPRASSWVKWADLLRRVFEIDVLACARCGGRLRFVAAIDDPEAIRRILGHLGLPTSITPPLPARPPPGGEQVWFDRG